MKTKVFLTGLALLALTMVGNAQNKKGPGTGVCDGTGPKTGISVTSVENQVFDAVVGVVINVPVIAGDGVCDCVGVCDQDCINNQVPIQDKTMDKDRIKAKDGTCVNK